jgi:hypothetical protein
LKFNKKFLTAAVFLIAVVQTPGVAVSPAINSINTEVFPGYGLSAIQTVLALSGLAIPFAALISAWLIRVGVAAKRDVIV